MGRHGRDGLDHLIAWADQGVVPPHAARLEFDNDTTNDGSRLSLDANGNVKGGVRNTYVDVPVAAYGVPNAGATPAAQFNCSIAGWRLAYGASTLNDLYKNKGSYISAVNRRLMELARKPGCFPNTPKTCAPTRRRSTSRRPASASRRESHERRRKAQAPFAPQIHPERRRNGSEHSPRTARRMTTTTTITVTITTARIGDAPDVNLVNGRF